MANKTLIRLAQLTGSLDDTASAAHPSAITDKSLQGVLDQLASAVKRITGAGTYSQGTAGQFDTDIVIAGTTPKLTIGDGGAEDTMMVFDGNAQDYRIGLDDGTDKLELGVGSAHGTTTALTVDASQQVVVVASTEATSATDGALTVTGGVSVAKSVVIGDDLDLLSNAAVLKVGSDQPFTLTHANASNTLLASANHRLAFGDAGDYIAGDGTDLLLVGSADVKVTGDLVPSADDTYDLGTTTLAWQDLHMEGDVLMTDAGKVSTAAGDLTIESAAADVVLDAATDIVLDADGGDIRFKDGGATQIHFDMAGTGGAVIMKPGVDSDRMVFQQFDGTEVLGIEDDASLKIAGGLGSSGVTVTSAGALSADGRIVTDDATEATSTTDGSLQTDGGLSVAKSAVIGDDLDLLSDGAILSVGAGKDVTLTHDGGSGATLASAGAFLIDGANTVSIDGASGINIGTNDSAVAVSIGHSTSEVTVNDNLTITGDLTVNGATVTVDTTNLSVKDPVITLNEGGQSLNANGGLLFTSGSSVAAKPGVAFGRVANDTWGLGQIAVPTSGTMTTVAGMTTSGMALRAGKFELDSAADYIELDTNIKIIAAADVLIDPAGGELVVDGNVVPNSDSADSLGASGTAWANLYVDAIDLNGQGSISLGGTGRIDLDADDDTSIRSPSDDVITFEAGGADVMSMDAAGLQISDDKKLYFGLENDASFEYDEDGNDVLLYTGASLRIDDDVKIEFGAAGDAGIEYDEDGTDQLRIHAPAAGVVIGGTNPKLVIGDAGAEDTMMVFDGNAVDFRIGLDDGTDSLEIGVGDAHGTTPAITVVGASQQVDIATDLVVGDDVSLKSDAAVLNFGDNSDVNLTHVHNTGLLLNGAMQLQLGDSGTTIAQSANGILNLRSDGTFLFDGGGSMNWHMTGSSRVGVADNSATAFAFQEGANNLFAISTANGAEVVRSFKLLQADANIKMNADSSEIGVADSQALALSVKNASGATYLTVDTANSFVGTPDNIQLGAGTGRDLYMAHNGTNSEISNVNGLLSIANRGGNLILSASANNAELQFGDAYCGNIMNGGLWNLADSAAEWNSYVSNFANNKSLVGALNSLAGGGTRNKFQVAVTGSHAANIPLLVHADLNHDQGSETPATLDVFVNGQLLTSGTAISDGDYKIGITSADHIQFFFALESGDQVTVVKP